MRTAAFLLFAALSAPLAGADGAEAWRREAEAAEAALDAARALEHYLRAGDASPGDPRLLQKIARQYSDLVLGQPTREAKLDYAAKALDYSRRAAALDPRDAVNQLSVAISYGKLATYSDTRAKVQYSRLVREHAEKALALDPGYAWAHHILGRWHHEVAELGGTARFFVKLFYGGLPAASSRDAVVHLRRATELEPAEANHWLELGQILAAAGDRASAKAAWARGLALPSRDKHAEPAKRRARAALAETK
jgi:tetratricopeptide (TPR) repeat protein